MKENDLEKREMLNKIHHSGQVHLQFCKYASFLSGVCVCVCVCVRACVGSDVYVSCWNLADHRMEEWTENVGWE